MERSKERRDFLPVRGSGMDSNWKYRLADRLAKEGLIEFAENRNHLRSKLMRISPKGLGLLDRIAGRYEPWVADLASEFDLSRVRSATLTITGLRERLMQQIREARNTNSRTRPRS